MNNNKYDEDGDKVSVTPGEAVMKTTFLIGMIITLITAAFTDNILITGIVCVVSLIITFLIISRIVRGANKPNS